jgi:REP element-mobilizing transposase RayT
VLPGVACHITQRGVDRRETFSSNEGRQTYLRLLRQNWGDAGVSLLGWCLMTNHVHLIGLPAREDSLVERNPARAGMVRRAADYRWCSAASHLAGEDE